MSKVENLQTAETQALNIPVVSKRWYYTEYPTRQFQANSDDEAMSMSKAKVLYRESDTEDGTPFIMLRNSFNGC